MTPIGSVEEQSGVARDPIGREWRRLFGALGVAAVIALAITALQFNAITGFVFEVEIESPVPGIVQLFYDVGHGFIEIDSARDFLSGGAAKQTYRFRVPRRIVNGLRFDPIDREGRVTFSRARIVQPGFLAVRPKVIWRIPPEAFKAAQQIRLLSIDGETVRMDTVEAANDPILTVTIDPPIVLRMTTDQIVLRVGLVYLQMLLPFAACFYTFSRVIERHRPALASLCSRIAVLAQASPNRAIAAVAVCAAILSVYPVVFFGKSFVSPNHGTYLLYDRMPTLPGYDSTQVESVMGSDVGAIMWAFVPYSVVESRALWRDSELPLWNRYNSTGVTLLGQGQSMFGDPLHLIVLAAGGASWAWDIKYVIARILFAAGIGLTVYIATRHLPAALLLAVSAPFIGLFTFRVNHAAIFSLCYSPWILYAWFRIVSTESTAATVLWSGGLALASWFEVTSGTAKEAYMLLITLNMCGLLLLLLAPLTASVRLGKLLVTAGAGAVFVLISAPVWLTFLDAMRSAYTSYNAPGAVQIQPSLVVGLFDDIFYREMVDGEGHFAPSANFLVLFGVLWSLACLKDLLGNRAYIAIALSGLVAFALVFGVVPASLIAGVPYLGNVIHIDNTFSAVLIVHLFILAGFGLKACWDELMTGEWKSNWAVIMVLLGALLALYFGSTQAVRKSPFFYGYAATLVLGVVLLPWGLRQIAQASHGLTSNWSVGLLLGILLLLHWRHGMHISGLPHDKYVLNPQVRADLQPHSPALDYVKSETNSPVRVVGLNDNLMAGVNAVWDIESINGPDALMNPYYRELSKALPYDWGWDWRIIVSDRKLAELTPVYDFLNVKYYLASPGQKPAELHGLHFSERFDLDVYRSDTVWPRAFFTDTLSTYDTATEFVGMLKQGDGRPFAAFQRDVLVANPQLEGLLGDQKQRQVVPADKYKLTANTTSFTLVAPSKGIIVFSEAYLDKDFQVTVNGRSEPYFRVNHAFKGVLVERPGTYILSFSYWPHRFTRSLWASGIGTLLLVVWIGYSLASKRAKKVRGLNIQEQASAMMPHLPQ